MSSALQRAAIAASSWLSGSSPVGLLGVQRNRQSGRHQGREKGLGQLPAVLFTQRELADRTIHRAQRAAIFGKTGHHNHRLTRLQAASTTVKIDSVSPFPATIHEAGIW